MNCPDCGGIVRFGRMDISCSICGWTPSPTVLDMYRLAPMTNRKILWGTLGIIATAASAFIFYGIFWPAIALCACGLALVPIHFAVRSWTVKKMMEQLDVV